MLVPNTNTRARCTGDDESAPKTRDSTRLRRCTSRLEVKDTSTNGSVFAATPKGDGPRPQEQDRDPLRSRVDEPVELDDVLQLINTESRSEQSLLSAYKLVSRTMPDAASPQLTRHVGQAVHHVHIEVVRPRQQQPHLTRAALKRHRAPLWPPSLARTPIRIAADHMVPPSPLAGSTTAPILHPKTPAPTLVLCLRRLVEAAQRLEARLVPTQHR